MASITLHNCSSTSQTNIFRPWQSEGNDIVKLENNLQPNLKIKPKPVEMSKQIFSKNKRKFDDFEDLRPTKIMKQEFPGPHHFTPNHFFHPHHFPAVPPMPPLRPTVFNSLVPLIDNPGILIPVSEMERVCAKKPRPKKFVCSDCGAAFSNRGQLCGHNRIHTGERPFTCPTEGCGKSFTRNEELTRHKRIHSGLRPYPCEICQKRFGRKDHLKKHIRTHTRHMPHPVHPMYALHLNGFPPVHRINYFHPLAMHKMRHSL